MCVSAYGGPYRLLLGGSPDIDRTLFCVSPYCAMLCGGPYKILFLVLCSNPESLQDNSEELLFCGDPKSLLFSDSPDRLPFSGSSDEALWIEGASPIHS